MKILVDIGHPGHVHLFRPFAIEMQNRGHKLLFTFRQKEFEKELLQASKFEYISFGKHYSSKLGKIYGLVKFDIQMYNVARKFKPDLFLSHGSIYAAFISYLLRKPHISMEDSGNMEQIRLYLPFTNIVLTPNELQQDLGEKQIKYSSYHELAYLHPKYFTPDKRILDNLGIGSGNRFAVLRLISWNATHDIGQGGFTSTQLDEIISYLSNKMKLLISSEGKVPVKHQKYLIKIEPEKIHHVLFYADIVISEGATMASESGVLGTPAIYVNSLKRCYNEDQERYGTVFNYRTGDKVLSKVKEILNNYKEFVNRNKRIIEEKIDLTAFLVWFVENYPNSAKVMKDNSNYQYRFK